jgi:hypothetical protein
VIRVCIAGITSWTGRPDAGETPAPYVAGTLLAIRARPGRIGLALVLDKLLG